MESVLLNGIVPTLCQVMRSRASKGDDDHQSADKDGDVRIAIFAALVHRGIIPIPQLHSGFTVLLISYWSSLAGNVVRGI